MKKRMVEWWNGGMVEGEVRLPLDRETETVHPRQSNLDEKSLGDRRKL
jgi:hypothetical protein